MERCRCACILPSVRPFITVWANRRSGRKRRAWLSICVKPRLRAWRSSRPRFDSVSAPKLKRYGLVKRVLTRQGGTDSAAFIRVGQDFFQSRTSGPLGAHDFRTGSNHPNFSYKRPQLPLESWQRVHPCREVQGISARADASSGRPGRSKEHLKIRANRSRAVTDSTVRRYKSRAIDPQTAIDAGRAEPKRQPFISRVTVVARWFVP